MPQVMGHFAYVLVELGAYGLWVIYSMLSQSTGKHRMLKEVVYDGDIVFSHGEGYVAAVTSGRRGVRTIDSYHRDPESRARWR